MAPRGIVAPSCGSEQLGHEDSMPLRESQGGEPGGAFATCHELAPNRHGSCDEPPLSCWLHVASTLVNVPYVSCRQLCTTRRSAQIGTCLLFVPRQAHFSRSDAQICTPGSAMKKEQCPEQLSNRFKFDLLGHLCLRVTCDIPHWHPATGLNGGGWFQQMADRRQWKDTSKFLLAG